MAKIISVAHTKGLRTKNYSSEIQTYFNEIKYEVDDKAIKKIDDLFETFHVADLFKSESRKEGGANALKQFERMLKTYNKFRVEWEKTCSNSCLFKILSLQYFGEVIKLFDRRNLNLFELNDLKILDNAINAAKETLSDPQSVPSFPKGRSKSREHLGPLVEGLDKIVKNLRPKDGTARKKTGPKLIVGILAIIQLRLGESTIKNILLQYKPSQK